MKRHNGDPVESFIYIFSDFGIFYQMFPVLVITGAIARFATVMKTFGSSKFQRHFLRSTISC